MEVGGTTHSPGEAMGEGKKVKVKKNPQNDN